MNTQARLGNSLLKSLISLREQKGSIRIEDVGAMFEDMAATLHPETSAAGTFLRQEIEKMAKYIIEAKQEISSLAPEQEGENSTRRLSDASMHLDAVVKATEEATGIILDAADDIQSIVSSMGTGSESEMRLSAATNRIYEACNFQDLTGQRITKVIATLEYIEGKIFKLIGLFGEQDEESAAAHQAKATSARKDTRSDAHLLNGPQLPGSAPSQTDIDALFANLK